MFFLWLEKPTFFLLSLLFISQLVNARLPDGRMNANSMRRPTIPRIALSANAIVKDISGNALPPYETVYWFDQLIDHTNPGLGTFKQRYWHTWEYYKPGGPIILTTPGESNAEGSTSFLTNQTMSGKIAEQQNGATVVLEHRFFGLSNPYPDLSVKSLQVLTIQQAIDDLVYFAETVKLEMPGGDQVSPEKAPWVLVGGSYSGALTTWTMSSKPGIFWAGYSSSGVVQPITDFWGYFEPIRQNMPKNCSADVQLVIAHIDQVLESGDQTQITNLMTSFGLGNLTHTDDFVSVLRNPLMDWQQIQPGSDSGLEFFKFCDTLEVKDGQNAPESGWGLDNALKAWSTYFRDDYLQSICGTSDLTGCVNTHNTSRSYWTDTTVDNADRSWLWMVCNEVGWFKSGPPTDHPAIVSRHIQPDYDERLCQQYFPEAYSPPTPPRVDATVMTYSGWNVRADRLFVVTGARDPWREATFSATGVDFKGTALQPIALGDGFHCSDLGISAALVDESIATIQTDALTSMKTWLATYKPKDLSVVSVCVNYCKAHLIPRTLPRDGGPRNLVIVDRRQVPARGVASWRKESGTL